MGRVRTAEGDDAAVFKVGIARLGRRWWVRWEYRVGVRAMAGECAMKQLTPTAIVDEIPWCRVAVQQQLKAIGYWKGGSHYGRQAVMRM